MSSDPTTAALSVLAERYEIIRELGRGGTAVVYLGRERASGAEVAIKLIRAKYVEDEETVARFAREARYAGELHHPNVVTVRSVVELGAQGLALVMDHVPGPTLKQLIHESGPIAPARAEAFLRDIAGALGAAHAMGIVHRDVKPENIFIDDGGRALLADFGVARSMTNDAQLTMNGIAIGTPAYMAPEQIDGIPVDGRGDIYSLGLVGWEMLTGERPWDGSGLYAVIYRQKHEDLPDVRDMRPDVPDSLAEVIAGAIEKDRADRWQSAEEMVAALDGAATRRPSRPDLTPMADETRRFVRPIALADAPHDLLAANSVQAALREIATSGFTDGDRPANRRRMAIGAGALAALLLVVSFGVALSTSQADTRVEYRSTGEVTADAQADGAMPIASDPMVVPAGDTGADFASSDLPRAETLHVATPLPVVRRAPGTADPAPAVAPRGVGARDGRESPSEASATGRSAEAANAPLPRPPTALRTRISIGAGGAHSCLVTANGRLLCWGGNDRGQLGTGTTARLTSPGPVATDLRFASVASGLSHSCALTVQGAAWCWGDNARGQLGDRSFTGRREPVPVADDRTFRVVATGAAHTCALDGEGKPWCWGADASGQLGSGDGSSDGSSTPVAVATDHRFTSVATGWEFSCGLAATGSVLCWGENSSGQLGDGTREDRQAPTAVRTDVRFTSISAGSHHACGVTATGDAYCWGRNTRGQLGDGTRADRTVPVRVQSTVPFVAISAGVHTCAITGEGAAYCWGQNAYGQLGDGGTTDQTRPVAVAGDHAFAIVRAFGSHTCGATASGEAFCWGYNLDGQLGDGTRVHRTRPVYVEPTRGR